MLEIKEKAKTIDSDTNFIYLSDILKKRYPDFFRSFTEKLESNRIHYELLMNTKDIWAVDYMPVQVYSDKFVKFRYYPDYLRNSQKWSKTITDCAQICKKLGIDYEESELLIDGGNIVRSRSKVILTEKIFFENPTYDRKKLVEEIESLLELEVVTIPYFRSDFIGHADGYVRFYDENTVLISDMSGEDTDYVACLKKSLKEANLDIVEIPYNPYGNKTILDATGLYINYLQMKDVIFLPVFGLKEEDSCLKLFEQLFPESQIVPVQSKQIAKQGGVLNCISWNVYQRLL